MASLIPPTRGMKKKTGFQRQNVPKNINVNVSEQKEWFYVQTIVFKDNDGWSYALQGTR